MKNNRQMMIDRTRHLEQMSVEQLMDIDGGLFKRWKKKRSTKTKTRQKRKVRRPQTNLARKKLIKTKIFQWGQKNTHSSPKKKKNTPDKKLTPVYDFPAGRHIIDDDLVYNPRNRNISYMNDRSVTDDVEVHVNRSPGHTRGHYLSTVEIKVGDSVLFRNAAHSYADKKDLKPGFDFTVSAGRYEAVVECRSSNFKRPLRLSNPELGVLPDMGFLLHANAMLSGHSWSNTGSSRGCVVMQGQNAAFAQFVETLGSTGIAATCSGRRRSRNTVPVIIHDPAGRFTTRDGREILLGNNRLADLSARNWVM